MDPVGKPDSALVMVFERANRHKERREMRRRRSTGVHYDPGPARIALCVSTYLSRISDR